MGEAHGGGTLIPNGAGPGAAESLRPDVFQTEPLALLGSECPDCQRLTFPPREVCPFCGQVNPVQSRRLSTRGVIYSYTIVRQAPPPFVTPYVLAYVDLPEDQIRVMGQIIGLDPNDAAIGLSVALTRIDVKDTEGTPKALFAFTTTSGDEFS